MNARTLRYRRVLLKLSGEAFRQNGSSLAVDPSVLGGIVSEITKISDLGVQIGIVPGGGNFIRGKDLVQKGIDRITADQMGMLGTVINALALKDRLENYQKMVRVMSAVSIKGFTDHFDRDKAIRYLEKGYIVIFSAGTGNPLVSTDSAASLRGIEINAEILLKATQVDGVYSADPKKEGKAILYSQISYEKVLDQGLGIMDLMAFVQCRNYGLPIIVFNMAYENALIDIVQGKNRGTLVSNGDKRYDRFD